MGGVPELPQSWNRYTYVQNNPMNRVDPFGLEDAPVTGEQPAHPDDCSINPTSDTCHTTITVKPQPTPPPGNVDEINAAFANVFRGFFANDMTRYLHNRAERFRLRGDLIGILGYGIDEMGANSLSPIGMFALGLQPENLAAGALRITFGHGARHLAGTALSEAAVNSAIRAQLSRELTGASMTGSFWGKITIGGETIIYRAFTLSDGTINVGTYYKP
jgi:hypothetical protein